MKLWKVVQDIPGEGLHRNFLLVCVIMLLTGTILVPPETAGTAPHLAWSVLALFLLGTFLALAYEILRRRLT